MNFMFRKFIPSSRAMIYALKRNQPNFLQKSHFSKNSDEINGGVIHLRQTLDRCLKLASSLTQLGISRGDVVATLSPNVPAMYELHFGVPMAGAILCTLNTRQDSAMVSTPLKHSEAKIIFCRLPSEKGVVFLHGVLYLNSLATVMLHGMGAMPVYLWTVPMFHCNGWCLTWEWQLKVVPIPLPCKVNIMTGGSAPPAGIIFKMEELGFNVSHLYGLTETYGPATICAWQPEWDSLPHDERARKKLILRNPVTMESVPDNGKTMGEVISFKWRMVRSGDLAVKHSDGFIEVKDRSKDVVISGGENISTIEVESVLFSHPSIFEAAVVGRPDNHWGETPCAFVKLKDGCSASAEEIIQFCKDRLPRYMAPKTIVFADLPKTSTGKTQKYILREKAKSMGSLS
ncbi:hypothetical protein MKW92_004557 [Papaver armeniacum]|nr:hypothetical protein MKW92_004557 [Papaver armeniacum]